MVHYLVRKHATRVVKKIAINNKPTKSDLLKGRTLDNAHKSFEYYMMMAQEASTQGDRVLAETYLQQAEHFLRSVAEEDKGETNDQSMKIRI